MVVKKKAGSQPTVSAQHQFDSTDGIAAELRIAREAKNLTFSDLNRLTGISRTTLHDYESSRSKPGAKELVKLCEVLEVSPNRLLLGTEVPSIESSGVLVSLVKIARTKPERALSLSLFIVPLIATILSKIGNDALIALSTLADETLRARDPETFASLSKLVTELSALDAVAMAEMPVEKQQELVKRTIRASGLPTDIPSTDS